MALIDPQQDGRTIMARRRARQAGRGRESLRHPLLASGRIGSPPVTNASNGGEITFQGLDPALGSLGLLIGLLREDNTSDSRSSQIDPQAPVYILVSEWFQAPIDNLKKSFNENSAQLAALLSQLLGAAAGQALGVPIKDAALLGTWYPLVQPVEGKTHGLYLVSSKVESNQIFGLGVLGRWNLPDADPLFSIDVWGTVPMLRVGGGTVQPVITEHGYPLTLGIAVEGTEGKPLFDMEGISFDGVKVTASLDLAVPAVEVSVVALRLKLPGDKEAADRSLTELLALSGTQIQDTIVGLFIGALSQVSETAANEARYLLPVLGVKSQVPGIDTPVPLMRWDQFLSLAIQGGDLGLPFKNWFGTLTSNPNQLSAWMAAIGGAVGSSTTVSGSGPRNDPFTVVLLDLSQSNPAVGTLAFTMGSMVADDGTRLIYPGLGFQAVPQTLGSSRAVIRAGAALELAQFRVVNGRANFGTPTALGFTMGIALTDKDAHKKLAEYDGFSADALSAGIGLSVGNPIPVPKLTLDNVATPTGVYATIDLLNPGELAAAAEKLLPAMVQQQLEKLLGITAGGTPVPYASNVAALIGVVPPVLPAGNTWPSGALPPPFSAPQIMTTIADPVSALGTYYYQVLTSPNKVAGRQAFVWMVEELTGLIALADAGTVTIDVTGNGLPNDPWSAALTVADTKLPARLTGFTQAGQRPGGNVSELVIGLALEPQLTLNGTRINPSLLFNLVSIDLPAPGSKAPLTGLWAPLLASMISLPDGFVSPNVGGAVFSMGPSKLSGRWSRTDGWGVSLLVTDPVLLVDGQRIALGQSLDFADPTALANLVRNEVAAFLDMITGLLGVALLRMNNRAGIAMAGIFGLLKDIAKAEKFPPNLTWPKIELLHLDSFANPWPMIRQQIARDLATPDTAQAVLSLLGWTLDSSLTAAPVVPGAGTPDDPYRMAMKNSPFDLQVWTRENRTIIGVGLGRRLTAQFNAPEHQEPIKTVTDFRLNAMELNLSTGKLIWGEQAPMAGVLTTVSRVSGPLIPTIAGTELGSLQLGLTVRILSEGQVNVAPVLTLYDVTLPGEPKTSELTLQQMLAPAFGERLLSVALALVNSGIGSLCQAATANPTFQQSYTLLSDLGIALPYDFSANAGTFGINPGGWSGLISDPLAFASTQFSLLLIDPDKRMDLFNFLQTQLGITLPKIPQPVLSLLCAIDLLGPETQGYPLLPDAMLAYVQSPFGTLTNKVRGLLADPDKLVNLKTQIKGTLAPPDFGPFTFTVTNGSILTLKIKPENAPVLAGIMLLTGAVKLDLDTPSLTAEVYGYIPMLGMGPLASLTFGKAGLLDPKPQVAVAFGDGKLPAPPPVVVYPFDSNQLLNQLSTTVPVYALSVLTNLVVEGELLKRYPLAQKVFAGLGLAQEIDGQWRMPALPGLLANPRGWLLSEGVLGQDGQFSVAGFARWLSGLPQVNGPYGLKVEPLADGVSVTGMPYGVGFSLTGKDDLAVITLETKGQKIAGGAGMLDALSLGVQLNPLAIPGFVGTVHLSKAVGSSAPFFVKAGYNKEFQLSIGQQNGGTTTLSLQLLPYQGLGSLLEQLARQLPAVVINQVVPALLNGLEKAGAKEFVARMRTAGTKLDVAGLITGLSTLNPLTLATVETKALDWLRDRLSQGNAPATAEAVVALLNGLIPGVISSKEGLVSYIPSDKLPLALLTGMDATGASPLLGVWAELALPAVGRVRPRVQRTGIGVPLSGDPSLTFAFGAGVTLTFEDDLGPTLGMNFNLNTSSGGPGLMVIVDPMGSVVTGDHSDLQRELLPSFFPVKDSQEDPAIRFQEWLITVVTQVVPRYVAAVILNQKVVTSWLDTPLFGGAGGPTPGNIMVGSSVLRRTQQNAYALVPFQTLLALSPETFVAKFLRELLRTKLKVLSFGPGGSGAIWVEPDPNDATAFGTRVVIPNMPVPGMPNVVLRLGDQDDAWIQGSGGRVGGLEPGIAAYVPLEEAVSGSLIPRFDNLRMAILNVGLDFVGRDRKPLVDFTRFAMGGIGPRCFMSLTLNGSNAPDIRFGVAARATGLGLSLSPQGLPKGGNPVAANLLGTGGTSEDSGGQTDKTSSTSNPTFTALAAYSENLFVSLYNDDGTGNPIIIPVQRNFGPIRLQNLGIGWEQSDFLLNMMVSGGLSLAGFNASVESLTVGIPVKNITNLDQYKLDLQGLGIQFSSPAVTITGGFDKTTEPSLAYTGVASVVAAKFGLSAIGSYAMMATTEDPKGPTAPSLFIFASLNIPLGPDPAFFITGLAGGIAYNRSLTMPNVGEIASYPLISIMKSGGFAPDESPSEALRKLSSIVAPSVGQYWIAAGFKFNTYQLFDGLALAVIQFGRTFEIDLLGLAAAALPTTVGPEAALAYVELGIKAVIAPESGVISVEAQLTPNSFVLYKDVKLTGGFAFFLWLKNLPQEDGSVIPAGDFVVTLGGYNPAFIPPSHYPVVPRLGLQWQLDIAVGKVGITGGTYFALVPSAVMAGGYLNVAFEAGPIRAWLDSSANFIIQWQPFWFQVDIGVTVGIAFKTTIAGISITLSAELGASLFLEGPPTHGHVEIDWTIISFTIPIGDSKTATTDAPLDWKNFEKNFVPTAPKPEQVTNRLQTNADGSEPNYQPLNVAVERGRLGGSNEGGQDKKWILQAVPFALGINTALPASRFTFPAPKDQPKPSDIIGPALGIRPMGESNVDTPVTVSIVDAAGHTIDLVDRKITLIKGVKGAPAAIWSRKPLDTNYAPSGSDMTIDGALAAITLAADQYILTDTVPPFPLENLKYELATPRQLPFAIKATYGPAERYSREMQDKAMRILMETIMAPATIDNRNKALTTLRAFGIAAPANPSLSVMASSANKVLQAPPLLARPGVYQAPIPKAVTAKTVMLSKPVHGAPVVAGGTNAPRLLAVLHRYRAAKTPLTLIKGLPPAQYETVDRLVDGGPIATSPTASHRLLGGDKSPALHPGTHALWSVDHAHALQVDGNRPVRFVCFDDCQVPLADVTHTNGVYKLPEGTHLVVAQGLDSIDHGGRLGWQIDSQLLQVSTHTLVGEGCVVRPAHLTCKRRHGRVQSRRILDGRAMLSGNHLCRPDGKLAPGWVQTVFPGTKNRLEVRIAGPDSGKKAEAGLRVTARYGDTPAIPGATPLTASQIRQDGDLWVLSYDLSNPDNGTYLTTVVQPASDGVRLLAVYADRKNDLDGKAASKGLAPAATDPTAGTGVLTAGSAPARLTLVNAGNHPNAPSLAKGVSISNISRGVAQ